MNPLISLIIPVYNVEKYFDKCMQSVLAQTYSNFEVILVDDGSTDSSGKMCDEYAKKDGRITVYHKPNGGLSDARNYGVEHCNGDLVSFLDSDDYITEDYLEYLWGLMNKYDADMSCARHQVVRVNDKMPAIKKNDYAVEEVLNTIQMLEKLCYESVSADTKLYKKQHLLQCPYPVGKFYEDLATAYKIVGQCKKIAYGSKIVGFWLKRVGSITEQKISEKQFDIFDAADEVVKYYKEHYPQISSSAYFREISAGISFMTRLFSYNDRDQKEYFYRARKRIKKYIFPVIFDKKTPQLGKIGGLAIWLGYLPSKMVWVIRAKLYKKY